MTIEITRATYSQDGRSPGRSLGDRELALLQEGCDFSITRNIAVIAEQCLGIRDYTNFEYEASKNRFFFRDVAHNTDYTLTKDAGGNWKCDNSSSSVRINNVLISENVVELIIKVKAAYNSAATAGGTRRSHRRRQASINTHADHGSTNGVGRNRSSRSRRRSNSGDSIAIGSDGDRDSTAITTPNSGHSHLSRETPRSRSPSVPKYPPPSVPNCESDTNEVLQRGIELSREAQRRAKELLENLNQ